MKCSRGGLDDLCPSNMQSDLHVHKLNYNEKSVIRCISWFSRSCLGSKFQFLGRTSLSGGHAMRKINLLQIYKWTGRET